MFEDAATAEPSPALVSEIARLQELIRRDGTVTGASEDRTRAELIDPLLRILGWTDSSVVTRQYRIRHPLGKQLVDYALHPGLRGQPVAFIEAKRMWDDLMDEHRDQAFGYGKSRNSVAYVGLTNGDCWEFYEVESGRGVTKVSLQRHSAEHCASELQRFSYAVLSSTGRNAQEQSVSPSPHPHAYKRWSPDEEQQMISLYESGQSIAGIASRLGRRPSAIRSRLRRLESL